MLNIPVFIPVIFSFTTLATLFFFYWVIKNSSAESVRKKSNVIATGLIVWLIIQAVLALKNVYNSDTTSMPPKILLLGTAPAIITIIILFATVKGRMFIDSLPLKQIAYLNTIRILVELVLLWLFLHAAVPRIMTFEGRNFDILAGITAPFIAYFGFVKNTLSRNIILTWNFISLALLANIVINALLSAPFAFQTFAFDQPDIAILYFPFSWLPAFIVPVVLFGHLVSIKQLIKRK